MNRSALYLRQSLDKEGDELGIDRQRQECQKLATARSLTIVEEVVDNSVSASKGVRPGYQRLLTLIETGQIDVVVVLRVDRLLRRLTDLEALIELSERTGVQIATCEGELDLSSSSGRLIARILASVARSEVETKSARQQLAAAQKASMGLPHGGIRPYGYKADLITINEPEAAVLREMAKRIINGDGFKPVCWWANEAGYRSTQGKLFYPVNVRKMLTNKRYAGIREYKGIEYPAVWQPVFDAVTWERLQLVINSRSQAVIDRPVARKYLLTGLVFCGKCGLYMNGAIKHEKAPRPSRRTYACRQAGDSYRERGCGGIVRAADPLDDWIKECVIARLDTPALSKLIAGTDTGDLTELLSQRDLIRLRLDALVDDYASGLLNRSQFTRAKTLAETELQGVQARIDQVGRHQSLSAIPAGQSVRDAWDASTSDQWKRGLISLLIKKINVHSGHQRKPRYKGWLFDSEAIEIEWVV